MAAAKLKTPRRLKRLEEVASSNSEKLDSAPHVCGSPAGPLSAPAQYDNYSCCRFFFRLRLYFSGHAMALSLRWTVGNPHHEHDFRRAVRAHQRRQNSRLERRPEARRFSDLVGRPR